MLEVMVQLTDDNPMSIATTLDMLQLVNMIAQDIYCYFPDRWVGRCWNQMIKIIFIRGRREGEVSKLKKNKTKNISSPEYLQYCLLLWWCTSTLQVLDNNTGHTLVTESLETMLIVSKFLKELKEKSLSSHLTDQCCNLVKKVQ